MGPSDILTKETILAALRRLDVLPRIQDSIGDICVFGGDELVLAFDARESTGDVDAVFVSKAKVHHCGRQVSKKFNTATDFMNNGVKGIISDKTGGTHEGVPVFEYLLAMKCLASRVASPGIKGDRADVITLMHLLKRYDAAEVCDLVVKYCSERLLAPTVRFIFEEVVEEVRQ